MSSNISYRLATVDDAEKICQIYNYYVKYSTATFEYKEVTVEEMQSHICQVFKRHVWMVALEDLQIVGYAYGSDHRSRPAYQWLTEVSVYIEHTYRRSGFGMALYDRLHALLKQMGFITAIAGLTNDGQGSLNFHLAYGYVQIAQYPNAGYKFNQWFDTIHMMKLLNPVTTDPQPTCRVHELPQSVLDQIF